jgi:peptide/nickel transport system substrate-binding protein
MFAVLAMLVLAACAPAPAAAPSGDAAAAEGAAADSGVVPELVIAQTAEIPTMDGQMNWSMIGRNIYYQMYGYLTRHDENMVVVPELAESWEWMDEVTLRWHLREGVTFHNGEPFNAEAVKFSLERILNEETGAPWRASLVNWLDRVEVVDEYTVDVISKFPTVSQLLEVGRMPMVPPAYVQEVGNEAFAANPIGAGPYEFVEWVKGDRVVLERNEEYWSGAPAVERLVFRVIPEATTALAEIEAGTVDVATVSPEGCAALEGNEFARCVSARSIQNVQITFTNGMEDVRLRQAIAHAINVDSIIENIMGGRAVKSIGPLSQLVWGSSQDLPGYAYDPDLALSLLAEAGIDPTTLTIPLNFAEGRIQKGREVAEAISADLAKIGITAELRPAEYGVSLSASTATTGDPNQMFRDYLSGSCIGYFCSEELDSYLVPVTEVVDPEARLPLVQAAEAYLVDQVFWLSLYDVDLIYGVSNKVDWEPAPNDIKWFASAQPGD